MYRVELKATTVLYGCVGGKKVPNVPCGVERKVFFFLALSNFLFLMYRVELKALSCFLIAFS